MHFYEVRYNGGQITVRASSPEEAKTKAERLVGDNFIGDHFVVYACSKVGG